MSATTNFFLTTLGVILIGLVFYDIYATILRATKHPGIFSELINRGSWRLMLRLTQNLNRRLRHRFLSAVGPMLLPLLITFFLIVLLTGFALIYLPRLDTQFKLGEEVQNNSTVVAFYFSGITLTTLGYGDILPVSGITRMAALFESALGIAVISLSITYLLTVYNALQRKRTVALKFYHQARQGADVTGFLSNHFSRGRFHSVTEFLRDATHDLQELLESHIEHPVIHYFHPVEIYKGLPRALFFVLETVAILNAHVDEKEYIEAGDHPDVLIAGDNARYVLFELAAALKLEDSATKPFESEEETALRRRRCFNRAMRNLQKSKIKTRTDYEQAFTEYSNDRAAWERQLFHFADFLGYDWDEVTGDRSLEDATDEEVIERHEALTIEEDEIK